MGWFSDLGIWSETQWNRGFKSLLGSFHPFISQEERNWVLCRSAQTDSQRQSLLQTNKTRFFILEYFDALIFKTTAHLYCKSCIGEKLKTKNVHTKLFHCFGNFIKKKLNSHHLKIWKSKHLQHSIPGRLRHAKIQYHRELCSLISSSVRCHSAERSSSISHLSFRILHFSPYSSFILPPISLLLKPSFPLWPRAPVLAWEQLGQERQTLLVTNAAV